MLITFTSEFRLELCGLFALLDAGCLDAEPCNRRRMLIQTVMAVSEQILKGDRRGRSQRCDKVWSCRELCRLDLRRLWRPCPLAHQSRHPVITAPLEATTLRLKLQIQILSSRSTPLPSALRETLRDPEDPARIVIVDTGHWHWVSSISRLVCLGGTVASGYHTGYGAIVPLLRTSQIANCQSQTAR